MNIELANDNMIEQQVRPWDVLNDRVLKVMSQTPRNSFVPEQYLQLAYADLEIPIGHGETMMHPRVEGRIMQILDIQPTDKVYEIGTGSGYLTACMARLSAHVDSIEIHSDLSSVAGERLQANGINNVTLKVGDAISEQTISNQSDKYEVVVLTGSLPEYTDQFESLLNPGGRMFVVTGNEPAMQAMLITNDDGAINKKVILETSLAPLVGAEKQPSFSL